MPKAVGGAHSADGGLAGSTGGAAGLRAVLFFAAGSLL
jgi:hypothetical protein